MTSSIEVFGRDPLGEGLTEVAHAVEKASTFGTETTDNGTHAYGHVPHLGPHAWFHYIFLPLGAGSIDELDQKLRRRLPDTYRDLLLKTNGLYLFSGALTLYGLRRDYSRRLSIVEPFDLRDPNVHERPRAADPRWFIFAFYDADGSAGYIDPGDGRVYRANRNMTQPRLNRWPSLDAFLRDEVRRLTGHFDERGRQLDPLRPTTPDY